MIRRTLDGYNSGLPSDPTALHPAAPAPSGPVQKRKLDANGGIAPPSPGLPSPMPQQPAPAIAPADPAAAVNPANAGSYTGGEAPMQGGTHPEMADLLKMLLAQQGGSSAR